MVHKIEKWDPSKLPPHPRILLLGRSGSGKSTCLHDVLSYLADKIDLCLLFSPTVESIEAFRKRAPPSVCHLGGLKLEIVEQQFQRISTSVEEPLLDLVHGFPGTGKSRVIQWMRELMEKGLGWEHGVQFVCLQRIY